MKRQFQRNARKFQSRTDALQFAAFELSNGRPVGAFCALLAQGGFVVVGEPEPDDTEWQDREYAAGYAYAAGYRD